MDCPTKPFGSNRQAQANSAIDLLHAFVRESTNAPTETLFIYDPDLVERNLGCPWNTRLAFLHGHLEWVDSVNR